jgi:signal transduction histidine kinase
VGKSITKPDTISSIQPQSARTGYVRKKKLQTMLDSVTQQMYARNKELAETNKTLSLLRTIDALVLESHASLATVCGHITEAINQSSGYPFVGLLTRASQDNASMRMQGWTAKDVYLNDVHDVFARPLHLNGNNTWFKNIENSSIVDFNSLNMEPILDLLDCSASEFESISTKLPLKSGYLLKLIVRRRIIGVLFVGYYGETETILPSDLTLLNRLGESIGVALDNKLLFEENQHVLRQLKESNAKLRALDEAKDDFVSMASHQLRTPLTSVKGYVSMVLEGDAGEINDMQRQLLTQSFFSSQRMVYLIADLLNVSRLKTGKFTIDRTPINLVDVVEQEMAQLNATALSRNLKLSYLKPDTFPLVMLDETKTRQIIMNFVDNAIYYTPSGGNITLKLIDKPTTIEFRVEDDGIGVPKTEQAHLFTKFYRAGNARKARPDGTGLGLFMAKKVIIAQGGTLLFESNEGKGSTFGFVFSKSKIAVAPKTK